MNSKTLNFDVIVIGCGVAGITASIYLKRANMNVCVIEKTAPGGQLNMISEIENYPGYKAIDGPSLAYNMFEQMRSLNIEYKYGKAVEIVNHGDYKVVKTDKEELTCKGIIIATGRKPRELNLPNEKKLLGNGISYCSICDGTLYKDKEVCVVGGGNSAFEGTLYLSNICKKVYLIHRRDTFKGEAYLLDKIKAKDNVEIITNSNIIEIKENNDKVSGVVLDTNKEISCEGLFVYIGNVPIPVKCENMILEDNYIVVNKNMKTNIDNIYACGDIIKKDIYQVSTAVGEGSTAAMNLIKDIK
jgi:thioredoxin reductase (NADPH)